LGGDDEEQEEDLAIPFFFHPAGFAEFILFLSFKLLTEQWGCPSLNWYVKISGLSGFTLQ
jgi:hypothetical protein